MWIRQSDGTLIMSKLNWTYWFTQPPVPSSSLFWVNCTLKPVRKDHLFHLWRASHLFLPSLTAASCRGCSSLLLADSSDLLHCLCSFTLPPADCSPHSSQSDFTKQNSLHDPVGKKSSKFSQLVKIHTMRLTMVSDVLWSIQLLVSFSSLIPARSQISMCTSHTATFLVLKHDIRFLSG